jgi:hypothetical protein
VSLIIKPFVADCVINGKLYENLEVVDLNKKSVWVRMPDGRIIKRHPFRQKVTIKPILMTEVNSASVHRP